MKILLVQPFGSGSPPLGLCLLAAGLKKGGFLDVSLVDLADRGYLKDSIKSYYRSEAYLMEKLAEKPDVVMFTASVATFKEAYDIAKIVRPHCKYLLFGGPHATLFQHRVLELAPIIDIVVYGEADLVICDLVTRLESSQALSGLGGVIYRENGKIVKNSLAPAVRNLDDIPFPDRSILDITSYTGLFCLLTSRGCPYSCNFCSRPVTGKLFRGRSAANVVDEMEFLIKAYPDSFEKANRTFTIVDENFGVDKQRVLNICDEIIKRNLNIQFILPNGLHVASADIDMFKKMKSAGCEVIYFGAESGNDQILKIMRKSSTTSMIKRAVDLCHQAGIRAGGHFGIGWQGETVETATDTINFIKEADFDHANLNHAVPEHGTPLWEYVQKNGKFLADYTEVIDYSKFYMDYAQPLFETPEFTREQRIEVYKRGLDVIDNLVRYRILSKENILNFIIHTKDVRDYLWAFRRVWTLLFKSDLRRYYQPKPSVLAAEKKNMEVFSNSKQDSKLVVISD